MSKIFSGVSAIHYSQDSCPHEPLSVRNFAIVNNDVDNRKNHNMTRNLYILILISLIFVGTSCNRKREMSTIKISENQRYFSDEDGQPFFWLGDTGWLLFSKLDREETEQYLENRREKGFNVIQVMVLHSLAAANVYGDSALINKDASAPVITEGAEFDDPMQYDFWDHVDFVIDKAAEKGLYMALVPVWGSNVRSGKVSREQARAYAAFLGERYKNRRNIIWLNGGDTFGSDSTETWNIIGNTLNESCPDHLITFHPRGRKLSSEWFHNEPWLDFNMFQSGHRRYDQDTSANEHRYGEDNWKYVQVDYNKKPVKPTLDGEPSYENIPQGLHDPSEPYWTDDEVRRYAYWSVFAGACGHTYGHNAVMQMHKPDDVESSFGVKDFWFDAIDHPGAAQMVHLKNLILSRPYFERIPDQSLVAEQGEKHDCQIATRGQDYAFIYTWNGRPIKINMGKIPGKRIKATWYNPRDGSKTEAGSFPNSGVHEFDPPGEPEGGNDWVLILDGDKEDLSGANNMEKEAYIFTSFREPATDGLFLAYSEDGYHWSDLGGPFLKPEVGEGKLMRDPSMVKGPDGTFHLVWTTAWRGDKGFGYASSKDLLHWSEQKFIPAMEHDTSTVNVWAPELFYDDKKGEFIIIWASTIPHRFERGIEDERNNHRMYYTTTKDFESFSDTKLFLDPGFSVIDAVIVKRNEKDYVLVLKDNTRPNRNLKVAFSGDPLGPYNNVSKAFTGKFTEGPTVVRSGDEWLIYYDAYEDKKYGAVKTKDFKTFSDISDEITVPEGHKHGTICKIDGKVLESLKEKNL